MSCFHQLCGTQQMSEIIYVNGEKRLLYSLPLDQKCPAWNDIISQTKSADGRTSLYRNYVGYWKIVNDSLFLDSICVPSGGTWHRLNIQETLLHYDNVRKGYFAHWVEDNLNIAWGNLLWMDHIGWAIIYESEADYYVRNGVIKSRELYRNEWICRSDADGRNSCLEISNHFPFDEFPELNDSTKVIFRVKHVDVAHNGLIKNCEIDILRIYRGPKLSAIREDKLKQELANILVKYRLLSVLRRKNKYVAFNEVLLLFKRD